MKLLLDTSAFLWAILDSPVLSHRVRGAIRDGTNEVHVSAASFWEIAIKYGLGRLPLPEDPSRYLPAQRIAAGFAFLEIGEAEVCQIHRLPAVHRDPFDRLLVAQANCYGMQLVTNDPVMDRYPVRTLW
jgi:PIN domain nuclease of toxin-antitoxin system